MKFYKLDLKKIGNAIFAPGDTKEHLENPTLYGIIFPMLLKWRRCYEITSYPGIKAFRLWFKEVTNNEITSLEIYTDFYKYSYFHENSSGYELNLYKIKETILTIQDGKSFLKFHNSKDDIKIMNAAKKWWNKYYSLAGSQPSYYYYFKEASKLKEFLDDFDLDYFKKYK